MCLSLNCNVVINEKKCLGFYYSICYKDIDTAFIQLKEGKGTIMI